MEKMSEKNNDNQNSFLWKMVFTIKFYTFSSVSTNAGSPLVPAGGLTRLAPEGF
jgi:hypothetical protein